MFIMVDGIDGSGKSTIINNWKNYLSKQGKTVFNLAEYWQQNNGQYPEAEKLDTYDFLLSCEPTYSLMGNTIRSELINNGGGYPPMAIAEAYSLDRLILYKKIIIPALQSGKCVIQDRGISTSFCYQPIADPKLNFEVLSQLPGNALALAHRPDHLVVITVTPKLALQRLGGRSRKKDNAIFEKLDFQTKAEALFESLEYKNIFNALGAKMHYLPGNQKMSIIHKESIKLLTKLLKK